MAFLLSLFCGSSPASLPPRGFQASVLQMIVFYMPVPYSADCFLPLRKHFIEKQWSFRSKTSHSDWKHWDKAGGQEELSNSVTLQWQRLCLSSSFAGDSGPALMPQFCAVNKPQERRLLSDGCWYNCSKAYIWFKSLLVYMTFVQKQQRVAWAKSYGSARMVRTCAKAVPPPSFIQWGHATSFTGWDGKLSVKLTAFGNAGGIYLTRFKCK